MLRYLLVIPTLLFPIFLFSQSDDLLTSPVIVFDNYANPTNIDGTLNGATSSGAASCGALANDDVYYQFVSVTKAIKVSVNTISFDAVVGVLDATGNSMGCLNEANGTAVEVLRLNNLTPNETYYIRIHSADGIAGDGNFSVEYCYLPLWELLPQFVGTSIDDDEYKLYDYIRRTVDGTINIDLTRWRFRNLVTGESSIFTVPNNPSNNAYTAVLDRVECILGTVDDPFMCYGDSLEVCVEVEVDGFPCGYGNINKINFQEVPAGKLRESDIGSFKSLYSGFLRAYRVHKDQVLEWELYEYGELYSTIISPQGVRDLPVGDIPNILYNRLYEIRHRATTCGETGAWSELTPFFTENIPYVSVFADCGSIIPSASFLTCSTITAGSGYIWQFAPINQGDPTLTPIGPSITQDGGSSVNTAALGLTPGTTYRVAVRPIVANGLQIGDYGDFCVLTLEDDSSGFGFNEALPDDWYTYSDGSTAGSIEGIIYPNPIEDNICVLYLKSSLEQEGTATVYNLQGKKIAVKRVNKGERIIQVEIPANQNGTLILRFSSEGKTLIEKFKH